MPFSPAHPRSARCGDDSWRWELLRAATDALNESRSIRDRVSLSHASILARSGRVLYGFAK